jgi:hypothetical protein
MINKNTKSGHGFIADEIKDEDYVFCGYTKIPQIVLQEDGQWDIFLPVPEYQERNGLETYNCVAYGTLNCIETLILRLYGRQTNKSERYIGVVAKTSPEGNSPQKVIETIRKEAGLIDEELLPFGEDINTWGEYYSPDPMAKKYLKEGKKWLENFTIKHEWTFKPGDADKQEKLKGALRYSPLGVSVLAWQFDGQYYYKEKGEQDNHWVMLYGYKDNEYWKVFDHYDDTYKRLKWDYDFGFAKRYYLEEIKKKETLWQKIAATIKNYFR